MQNIDAIIFDLGGVLLNIDYRATELAMQQLLGLKAHDTYQSHKQSRLFDELETGRLGIDEFYHKLREVSGRELKPSAIDQAWNAMLGELPLQRMQWIKKLGKQKRLFLLSNTNLIHKKAFDEIAHRTLQGSSFDQYFERAYYSHELGLRKPDLAVFQHVLEHNQLQPDRTLFIDDVLVNVEGARRAGLHAYHLRGELLDAPLGFLL
ncbi:MAG: HAD family phosphatase [Proteobacteria bacterium]|nr:HAD family phosphatase [Pseudomonadota bacterium]